MAGNKNNIISKNYPQQHYSVIFNQKTGFFARIEEKRYEEPFWSEEGPELLDISITNYCERQCSFCYRNSNINGKHLGIEDYAHIINQAKEVGVLQIAIGGGNPNQHPNFVEFLRITSRNNIVPSYTSNGIGLTNNILEATKEYCGALAISAYSPYDYLPSLLDRISKFNIKTNLHFLLSKDSLQTAISWLEETPDFLKKINAIIFLNYKPINSSLDLLLKKSALLNNFFQLISSKKYFFKIGFDSCSISGIAKDLSVDPKFYESCESARFSAFISEELRMYPCSFMVNTDNYGDLKQNSIRNIWKHNQSFVSHRDKIMNNNCKTCRYENNCKGGCVFLPIINLCGLE
ncbi:MAG: radical SAM/SPASM domain-containing protein [Candidatus Subteraquimicrobiales bacterium]|nr:radical SAM/SPASM domain-containing protein [Candidatus Subteraquimicrobiales bacterium]